MVKKILFLVAFFWSAAVFSQCNYSFVMSDTGGNGWNGNTMSVIQNSVVVATLGSTFTSGSGPFTVNVALQNNQPFTLFWNDGGDFPDEIGLSVNNQSGLVFQKNAGTGTQNSLLYSGLVTCSTTSCTMPTTVTVPSLSVGENTADITWSGGSGATQWEVLVLLQGSPLPTATSVGTLTSMNYFTATGLQCNKQYRAYVRNICNAASPTAWRASNFFTTTACSQIITQTCLSANAFCDPSSGIIFPNTAGVSNMGSMGCLGSTPNPSWFYFRVGDIGQATFNISQNTAYDYYGNSVGTGMDVDYILYGPFSQPVTPCSGQLTPDKIVSCSFSAAPIENFTFSTVQTGDYYYLMVTNYSNNFGFIKIKQTGGTATFDCTGFRLNAFIDSNANGSKDTNELNFLPGQFSYQKNNIGDIHNVETSNGILNIGDTNATNVYDFSYQINPEYLPFYSLSTAAYDDVSIISQGVNHIYFPVVSTVPYSDIDVRLITVGAPSPGFTYVNKIVYTNKGTQTTNGTITFIKDNALSISSISQAGTVSTANGFTYNFSDLQPFETRIIEVTMQVPTIPTVQLGNLLHNSASVSILPTVDAIANNNTFELTQEIIGSYDPNDIMEAHGEQIVHATFDSDDYLYYTIRFENTGSASAINVRVNNLLDAKLDETSLKMVGSSHNFVMDRVNTNVAWNFNGIMLPATSQNPNASKGYVVYKIKPKPGYAIGDIIPSTASIYFDYNPAIVTNTFNTEFVAQLSTTEFENATFVFYPNPVRESLTVVVKDPATAVSEIVIYDVAGKQILKRKAKGSLSEVLDLSDLSNGLYLLEVSTTDNKKTIKKLLVE